MRVISATYQRGYERELQKFAGRVMVIDARGGHHEADAQDVTIIVENDTVILDDGVHPRKIIMSVVSVEELPGSAPAPVAQPSDPVRGFEGAISPPQPQRPQFTPGDGQVHD